MMVARGIQTPCEYICEGPPRGCTANRRHSVLPFLAFYNEDCWWYKMGKGTMKMWLYMISQSECHAGWS